MIVGLDIISASASFAVGCRLHTLPFSSTAAVHYGVPPSTKDPEKDAQNTLWNALYIADRVISRSAHYPSAIPEEVSCNIYSYACLVPQPS